MLSSACSCGCVSDNFSPANFKVGNRQREALHILLNESFYFGGVVPLTAALCEAKSIYAELLLSRRSRFDTKSTHFAVLVKSASSS